MNLMILAAFAAMLMQDGGAYPPKPGETPSYGLMVGPAAERYRELLKKEDQLTVARAQIRTVAAQLDYLRLLAGREPYTNAQRLAAEQAIFQAAQDLSKAEAEYREKYKVDTACQISAMQEPICPEKK